MAGYPLRILPLFLLLLVGCAGPAAIAGPWASPLEQKHPLVGRIWDTRARRFVSEADLDEALGKADFAVLGEIHDNPDAHRIQARLVRALTARGRRPALAFEMLDVDQQGAVDAALAGTPGDPEAIARAVDWAHSGWPAFALYRPIFEAGLAASLPIVAADLSNREARRIVMEGAPALPEEEKSELEKVPLATEAQHGWEEEMREEHCGALPEHLLAPMVLAQRARDLRLARRMQASATADGAVLIAGAGHARNDRAVPAWLARLSPARREVSVAMVEVEPHEHDPAAYGEHGGFPYDYVVFTPTAARGDPCEVFRHSK